MAYYERRAGEKGQWSLNWIWIREASSGGLGQMAEKNVGRCQDRGNLVGHRHQKSPPPKSPIGRTGVSYEPPMILNRKYEQEVECHCQRLF